MLTLVSMQSQKLSLITLLILLVTSLASCESNFKVESKDEKTNIIFILTDDQRYDELGFINPLIQTPNMDRMAREGVHFKNAFVTTSLCSPSRASILTGQYMHNHGVVDNNEPPYSDLIFFPQYLNESGYNTAFIGKWHIGGGNESAGKRRDSPQPGFDHWVSFAGQGDYYPKDSSVLNINGAIVKQKGYITDELTDYALDWLNIRQMSPEDKERPFFLYLSHKAVHSRFHPAERHADQYKDTVVPAPKSQADTPENYKGKPMWVKNQRNSWHGVDFPYQTGLNIQAYKMGYHRTISAVDDSLGRLMAWLENNGHHENTIVMLMGDNGFMFGEHGLIDKRNAYEESMRIPLLAWGKPIEERHVVEEIAANIDIAPTMLDIAGLELPDQFEGQSLYPLARNEDIDHWRSELLYEYYWEYNFPHTPTTFALRTDNFKYITYHGLWDLDELYDMQNDPKEMKNLINDKRYADTVVDMRSRLYDRLSDARHGLAVPFTRKTDDENLLRHSEGSQAAEFPNEWLRN